MASKLYRSRALAQALRPSKSSVPTTRNEAAARCFSSTARAGTYQVRLPADAKNMRKADRETLGTLEAPIVNPADKYQSKADNLHRYGNWLMGCLPKYIQQFSVWKDELTIYICPSGVIPVFTFLKCMPDPTFGLPPVHRPRALFLADPLQTIPPPSSLKSATSQPAISPPATSASKSSTTCSACGTTRASASRRTPTRPRRCLPW